MSMVLRSRQGRVEQWRVRPLSKYAPAVSTGGERSLRNVAPSEVAVSDVVPFDIAASNVVPSEVAVPKLALSHGPPAEVLAERHMEGMQSSMMVPPCRKHTMFVNENSVELDVGLKLQLGQVTEITNRDAISEDPLLICEVGQKLGPKDDSMGLGPGLELDSELDPDQKVRPNIGPDMEAGGQTVFTVLVGPIFARPPAGNNSGFLGVDFSNEKFPLILVPPSGFQW